MSDQEATPAAPRRVVVAEDESLIRLDIVETLRDNGFRGMLSLELFNRDYWRQDALSVARTGLNKMRAAVREGLAS